MRTIETDITVAPDGKAVVELQLPATVSAGKHRAVVVLDEGEADDRRTAAEARPSVEMPIHDFGPWPANLSLRREDLYGDHGR
jgi:hypothetical protein